MFTREDALKVAKKIKLSKDEQDNLLAEIKKTKKADSKNPKKDAISARAELKGEFNPLILAVVEKYSKSGLSLVELVELAEEGFHNAIEHWEVKKKKNHKFVYYAAWFIRAEIHKKLGLPVDVEGFGEIEEVV